MNLSAPKQWTFYIAAILWILGLLGAFVGQIDGLFTIAEMGAAYWLALLGGLVLIIGNAMEGV